ncbi:MAG TPA: Gfo/Idh/MocA family oxidoreductase [bacterium]|nr:Gfo/Idh/MocA family oxidoreductase [bacterium]
MAAVNWGVLGFANIARIAVIPALLRARNARLVAIASRTPARGQEAAEHFGIPRAYGTYEALLEDPEVQAIYIPLPNTLHREWTLRCAAAGKHVLCEKPLAMSAADCEEMIAGCRRHGVVLMEAFMYRFHPRTQQVLRLIASGDLGEVQLVRASFTSGTFPPRNPNNIRYRADLGGGALYDIGCYAVNICRAALGEPEEVAAFGSVGSSGVDEALVGMLRFHNGRVGVIDCGLRLAGRQEYEILGTRGRLTVPAPDAFVARSPDTELLVVRGSDREVVKVPGADHYQRMVEHFGDVLSGSPLELSPDDAVANVRTLEALNLALRSGTLRKVTA